MSRARRLGQEAGPGSMGASDRRCTTSGCFVPAGERQVVSLARLTVEFEPKCDGPRWVAYFDLLGMTQELQDKRYLAVFGAYQRAVEQLEHIRGDHTRVHHTWFSDTFVLATIDDSGPSFTEIELVSRWFAYFLIEAQIPLRGAIACGHMYADFANRIFIGEALVEAYLYGEAQDWVGYVLCPSTTRTMECLGIPVDQRLHYALWSPQWSKRAPAGVPDRLSACLLGSWITLSGQNPIRARLQEMAARHKPGKIRAKYERAVQFLDNNPYRVVHDG